LKVVDRKGLEEGGELNKVQEVSMGNKIARDPADNLHRSIGMGSLTGAGRHLQRALLGTDKKGGRPIRGRGFGKDRNRRHHTGGRMGERFFLRGNWKKPSVRQKKEG